MTITYSTSGLWNTRVSDKTTGRSARASAHASVGGYDAEVALLRQANPVGPGYLPLAATTPVTFDHATVTNANNKTYPFVADVGGVTAPTTLVMDKTAGTKAIATPSAPDSDTDGFTVADGPRAPKPPKS